MKGWADIGIGIKLIEVVHKPCKKVVSCKNGGAQFLAVRDEYIYYSCCGKRYDKEPHHPPEGIHIKQKRIEMESHQKDKPEQVRDQK